jgi:DNA mismatch repair protein MutL
VRDRALAHTVTQAYGSVLERGRHPIGVVYLDVPLELVDVNVHPQKAEVRFADPRAVSDAVYRILSVELARAFGLPAPSRSPWVRPPAAPPATAIAASHAAEERPAPEPTVDPWGLTPPDAAPPEPAVVFVRDVAAAPIQPRPATPWASLRFVAQVRQTYLVCEGADGLYVLDQHAAAERVNFDRFRKQYRARAIASQALLFPLTLDVSAAEATLLDEHAQEIAELGLDLRVRGPELVSVHAVPRLLGRASPERIVRDLLAEVGRSGRAFSDAVDLAIATMACHASIRAGDPISPAEADALLRALDQADFAGHCPHGRPVVTALAWAELERKVGRR